MSFKILLYSLISIFSIFEMSLKAAPLPPLDQIEESSFEWQNKKHYEAQLLTFQEIAEENFNYTINQIVKKIETKDAELFFKKRHNYLLDQLKDIIFNWMEEDVLISSNYYSESQINSYSSDTSEDEDGWRNSYMRGYDKDDSSDSESTEDYFSGNEFFDQESEDLSDEDHFEKWKISKIYNMLNLTVNSLEDFTTESIDISAIKSFLENYVEFDYSSLINEEIEGGNSLTSHDFINSFFNDIDIPKNILHASLGGLWFDFDWKQQDIRDELYIPKTYIATLNAMCSGERAQDTRRNILKSIEKFFTFNKLDFEKDFSFIPKKYNEYVEKKDWLHALIEWSVYTTYRKVFLNPAKKSVIRKHKNETPTFSLFSKFNKEKYLTSRLKEGYERAKKSYTKVYPHISTSQVSFKGSLFNIKGPLSLLRKVGEYWEKFRNRGTENIFVPQIYFIVEIPQIDKKTKNHSIRFLEVPLVDDQLAARPLTRDSKDSIFDDDDDINYFKTAKSDVIRGKKLQGHKEEASKTEIKRLIQNKGLCKPNLIHSERVLVKMFRDPKQVERLCQSLAKQLEETTGAGSYKVQSAFILAYSTNTVCPNCTPTLLTMMNSHEEGGFLYLLSEKLNSYSGNVKLQTPGYNPLTKLSDWTKFRLNTFITAKINFDSEAHDLADKDQHSHTKVSKPPKKTHNPHAKLFFKENTIDISTPPLLDNDKADPKQRFFYEFVGKDIHQITQKDNPYFEKDDTLKFPGVSFSSGSNFFKKCPQIDRPQIKTKCIK